jgi:hypothetical protein
MRASLVAVLGALVAVPAFATTMVAADLPTLTRKAQLIVVGKVTKVESRWTQDKSRVVTDIEIAITETVKGAPRKTVTLVQGGGTMGDVREKVHGMPAFAADEEVFLFLEPRGSQRFATVGMAQGKFRVQRSDVAAATVVVDPELEGTLIDTVTRERITSKSAPMPLEELKRQVRQALVDAAVKPSGSGAQPAGPTRPSPQAL